MWDLVPWPGIEPRPPALGARSLSHWITRDILGFELLVCVIYEDWRSKYRPRECRDRISSNLPKRFRSIQSSLFSFPFQASCSLSHRHMPLFILGSTGCFSQLYFKKNWFHHLDYRLKQLKALLDYHYNPVDSSFSVLSVTRWTLQGRFFYGRREGASYNGTMSIWCYVVATARYREMAWGLETRGTQLLWERRFSDHGMLSPMTGRQL